MIWPRLVELLKRLRDVVPCPLPGSFACWCSREHKTLPREIQSEAWMLGLAKKPRAR